MKVELEVSDETIANCICSAVESASIGYWLNRKHPVEFIGEGNPPLGSIFMDYRMYYAPIQEGSMVFYENDETEEGKRIELKRADFEKALHLMGDIAPTRLAEILADDTDSVTADILIQIAAFGKIRYC